MQNTDTQGLQSKAEARLASLKEEKLVTRIAVLSTSLGQGKITRRLMIGMSIETHKTSPDFDQKSVTKQGAGSCRRWVILIVTCLSKWIDKDNFQGFDVCVMQRPLALRERCSSYCLPETCKCNVRRYGCRAVDHVRWRRLFHSSGCSPKHWNSRRGAVTLSFKGARYVFSSGHFPARMPSRPAAR